MSDVASRRILGVDTGGTYTDAVIYQENPNRLIAKAKAPTTHDNLAIGIGQAIEAVVAKAEVPAGEISFVSLSTTLATNSLVEGKGRPAGLVMIGFEESVLDRCGLREAIGNDPVIMLDGGHTPHGAEAAPLNDAQLRMGVSEAVGLVDGFAVTSQFSVRNSEHELAAREIIRELCDLPVTCSHELAEALNGPKRSITALLNARMIALIDELVNTTASVLAAQGIAAPIMVVRGNGSLVSADFVKERPVETILSGPAASLLGAVHLVGSDDAIVADIGGTTTDIAQVRGQVFDLSGLGAKVGGHQTMVEAVNMATHGLGGDSEVLLADRPKGADLRVGPRRVVPLVVMAERHGKFMAAHLKRQFDADTIPQETSATFIEPTALAAGRGSGGGRDRYERQLLANIGDGIAAADEVVITSRDGLALRRLAARGLVRLSAFTPTDASHVLDDINTHDQAAALAGAQVWTRRCDHTGKLIFSDTADFAKAVVNRVVRSSAEMLLAKALASDNLPAEAATGEIVAAALDCKARTTKLVAGLAVPIVAMGAPAATYYPAIAELLGTTVEVPEHADVANAIGAAVGKVRLSRRVVVSSPRRGLYRVHSGSEPLSFFDLEPAKEAALGEARGAVEAAMGSAGATEFEVTAHWQEASVEVGGRKLFVEGSATAIGIGSPHFG